MSQPIEKLASLHRAGSFLSRDAGNNVSSTQPHTHSMPQLQTRSTTPNSAKKLNLSLHSVKKSSAILSSKSNYHSPSRSGTRPSARSPSRNTSTASSAKLSSNSTSTAIVHDAGSQSVPSTPPTHHSLGHHSHSVGLNTSRPGTIGSTYSEYSTSDTVHYHQVAQRGIHDLNTEKTAFKRDLNIVSNTEPDSNPSSLQPISHSIIDQETSRENQSCLFPTVVQLSRKDMTILERWMRNVETLLKNDRCTLPLVDSAMRAQYALHEVVREFVQRQEKHFPQQARIMKRIGDNYDGVVQRLIDSARDRRHTVHKVKQAYGRELRAKIAQLEEQLEQERHKQQELQDIAVKAKEHMHSAFDKLDMYRTYVFVKTGKRNICDGDKFVDDLEARHKEIDAIEQAALAKRNEARKAAAAAAADHKSQACEAEAEFESAETTSELLKYHPQKIVELVPQQNTSYVDASTVDAMTTDATAAQDEFATDAEELLPQYELCRDDEYEDSEDEEDQAIEQAAEFVRANVSDFIEQLDQHAGEFVALTSSVEQVAAAEQIFFDNLTGTMQSEMANSETSLRHFASSIIHMYKSKVQDARTVGVQTTFPSNTGRSGRRPSIAPGIQSRRPSIAAGGMSPSRRGSIAPSPAGSLKSRRLSLAPTALPAMSVSDGRKRVQSVIVTHSGSGSSPVDPQQHLSSLQALGASASARRSLRARPVSNDTAADIITVALPGSKAAIATGPSDLFGIGSTTTSTVAAALQHPSAQSKIMCVTDETIPIAVPVVFRRMLAQHNFGSSDASSGQSGALVHSQDTSVEGIVELIHELFARRMESNIVDDLRHSNRQHFAEFLYDFFLQKHALPRRARDALLDVLLTLHKHEERMDGQQQHESSGAASVTSVTSVTSTSTSNSSSNNDSAEYERIRQFFWRWFTLFCQLTTVPPKPSLRAIIVGNSHSKAGTDTATSLTGTNASGSKLSDAGFNSDSDSDSDSDSESDSGSDSGSDSESELNVNAQANKIYDTNDVVDDTIDAFEQNVLARKQARRARRRRKAKALAAAVAARRERELENEMRMALLNCVSGDSSVSGAQTFNVSLIHGSNSQSLSPGDFEDCSNLFFDALTGVMQVLAAKEDLRKQRDEDDEAIEAAAAAAAATATAAMNGSVVESEEPVVELDTNILARLPTEEITIRDLPQVIKRVRSRFPFGLAFDIDNLKVQHAKWLDEHRQENKDNAQQADSQSGMFTDQSDVQDYFTGDSDITGVPAGADPLPSVPSKTQNDAEDDDDDESDDDNVATSAEAAAAAGELAANEAHEVAKREAQVLALRVPLDWLLGTFVNIWVRQRCELIELLNKVYSIANVHHRKHYSYDNFRALISMVSPNLQHVDIWRMYRQCTCKYGDTIVQNDFVRIVVQCPVLHVSKSSALEAVLVYSWTKYEDDFRTYTNYLKRRIQEPGELLKRSEAKRQLQYFLSTEKQFLKCQSQPTTDVQRMYMCFQQVSQGIKSFRIQQRKARQQQSNANATLMNKSTRRSSQSGRRASQIDTVSSSSSRRSSQSNKLKGYDRN
jgi:hypothetical protein